MSEVTNIILCTGLKGLGNVAEINAKTSALEKGVLECVDGFAGGTKRMETRVFMAAFSDLRLDWFLGVVNHVIRENRLEIQIMVQGQDSDRFDVYHLETTGSIRKVL